MRAILLAAIAALLPWPALADPVEGLWQTERNDAGRFAHVAFAPCGTTLCGTIATGFGPDNAPVPWEGENRPIVEGMRAEGGGAYGGGTIRDPDSGRVYRSKMRLEGDVLRVSGCIAGGLLCRTQSWRRVR